MNTITLTEQTPIYKVAQIIREDWKRVYFGAEPYLSAMETLSSINDRYFFDDGRSVVLYFLSNASTWKGEVAKQVKSHLKSLTK